MNQTNLPLGISFELLDFNFYTQMKSNIMSNIHFIHFLFAVFLYTKLVGEWLVNEMIELPYLNPHQRLLLLLLFCDRSFDLFVLR